MPEITGRMRIEDKPEDSQHVLESEWDPSDFITVLDRNHPSAPCILSPTEGAMIYLEDSILGITAIKTSIRIDPPGRLIDVRSRTIGNCLYIPLNEYIEEGEVRIRWEIILETIRGHVSYYFYVW